MYLSNLSLVLLRNDDLLVAKSSLLVNMPNDELSTRLKKLNPKGELTYFDNNYELHCQHQQSSDNKCIFASHYQEDVVHDLVIIHFPKSKKELLFTLAMLAASTNENTKVLFVGENKGGIKSIEKLVNEQTLFCDKIDAAKHCLLFEARLKNQDMAFILDDWFHYYDVNIDELSFKIAALPGVFSQAKLDIGSKVLLENLTQPMSGEVLDFGCGAGVIACYIGLKNKNARLTLADVSALALTSSEKTLAINNLEGTTVATNSLSNINGMFQYVISNPPFHQGIKTHYIATENFLSGIKKHLEKQGILTIVANSFLKYQPIMEQSIGKTEKLCQQQGFTIYSSKKAN
ncbi:methyltransferase [Colwelliaceae bacterium 6441]